MKNLALAAALLCILCLAPLLRAQDDTAVDPKRAAAAEELLKAMHTDELMEKQKAMMKKMMANFLPKDLSPEEFKQAQANMEATFDAIFKQLSWDTLKPDFIKIYSEVYTEQELKELTAFYNSPIGQKFIEKMPELQAKTVEIMKDRMQTLLPAIQAATEEAAEKAKPAQGAGNQPPPQPPLPPPLPPQP